MRITTLFVRNKFLLFILFLTMPFVLNAESIDEWYANAQQRIDTLRKGPFGITILDKNGQPFTGNISIKMIKHEFPFGIAFDLYEGAVNNGNSYVTTETISAFEDAEIYQTERWYSFLAYAIPIEKGRNFKLTLKFAEIYFDDPGKRIFDIYVEGTKYISDFDVFAAAGGKNTAVDTVINIASTDTIINIELVSSLDNAAIKGIEIETVEDDWIDRINCGGLELTTTDGHLYKSDEDYFDINAPRFPSEEQWMKAAMQKYFNYGVSGNSFKWSGIQAQHTTPDYTAFDNAVNWTKSIGWDLRAHTLLWGGYEYEGDHELPRWVKDLPTHQAITDTCKMRVIREVTRYKGIVKEYDVMNEPLHATYLSSIVGDSINWNCFKWARSADPDASLFINDYNVEYNWGDAAKYRDLILKIKSLGGPVTGVGMQAHFWDGMRPKLTELVTNINIVAEAGLPIKLTEFDNGDISQEDQANDLAMVTTIAFSHPSINGIVNWGLSDKGAWRTNSGLFEANHKPKLAADTLLYLTKNLWATNIDTNFTSNDSIMFSAYFGNYSIEVEFNDTMKVFTIPCIQANKDSVFVLNELDAIVKGPELVATNLKSDSSFSLIFNKTILNESITKGDFKFFSNNSLRIQDIKVDVGNDSIINIKLQNPITPDDYLSVSYFPGTLSSIDESKVLAFGPETIKNLTVGLISAEVTNDGAYIEAKFNKNILNLSENESSFSISDNVQPLVFDDMGYKGDDSTIVVFSMATPITITGKPTIKYTKGSLQTSNGFICQSSEVITVSNIWPILVSASVNSSGNKVVSLFGTLLQNVQENKNAFTISADGKPIEVTTITESGTDSSKITFNLSDMISKGQVVTISYEPGTIKGTNGNSLLEINEAEVTNNSATVGLENYSDESFSFYPNPASDVINIKSESELYSVSIYNSQGMLVYSKQSNSQKMAINVEYFDKGMYFIQVQELNNISYVGKIIIE